MKYADIIKMERPAPPSPQPKSDPLSLAKPSDFKRLQPAAVPEDKSHSTVEDATPSTVAYGPSSTVEDRSASTVEVSYWRAEGAPGIFTASRVRPVVRAQDSLTHVEEAVYDVLWGPKRKGEQEEHRTVSMGYAELAAKARVSKRTIQNVVARLIEKKFITIAKGADIYHRKAAVYQVRGYAAVIAAQRGEGKTWVLQTGRGVFFAHRLASTVEDELTSTVEASSSSTVEVPSTVTVEARSPSTVELPSTTSLGIKNKALQDTSSSPSAIVVEALRAIDPGTDDGGAAQLIAAAREVCPDAADEEIAHFILLKGTHKGIKQPLAFLKTAVPKCLQGESLRQYRRGVQQAREAQAQRDRVKREHWQRILDDPNSDEQAQTWAREALAFPAKE